MMRKAHLLMAAGLVLAAGTASAATIDGNITGGEYPTTLGTNDPSTSDWGPWGIFSLGADQDANNFYFGIRATPEVNFNSLLFVIGNQDDLAGIAAGTPLPNGGGGGGLGNLSLTVGFEVDYVFRITSGNTDESYYNALDLVNYAAGPAPHPYLGGGSGYATGNVLTVAGNAPFDGVVLAFKKSSGDQATNVDEGWEIQIPKSVLDAEDGDEIRVAVLYGNSDVDVFSNQQIPANTSSTTSGGGASIVAAGGGSNVADWMMIVD